MNGCAHNLVYREIVSVNPVTELADKLYACTECGHSEIRVGLVPKVHAGRYGLPAGGYSAVAANVPGSLNRES